MARNEHKKVLQQLSEAYQKVQNENLRQHQFFKKGIGSAVKEIFDIPKDNPKEDEEGERPYDINDPSTHYVVKTVGGQHGQIRGSVIFQGSLKDIVAKFGDAVDDPNDPDNWFEGELGIGEDAVVVSADPSDDFSSVEAYRAARGIAMPEDEEYDEYNPGYGKVKKPYEHKTDALVAAGGTKSEDIDKIDLSKWREYIKAHRGTGVDDIMKAVYRQYGKKGRATLPEVDSFDYGTMWSTKIRPFLMDKFPNS